MRPAQLAHRLDRLIEGLEGAAQIEPEEDEGAEPDQQRAEQPGEVDEPLPLGEPRDVADHDEGGTLPPPTSTASVEASRACDHHR
ncbi:MAG: hypothetical protein R3C69_15155 [Geminicoccaceae bacterium]